MAPTGQEGSAAGAEAKTELELRKLQGEVAKLAEEVPKLRNDNKWWNRHAGASVAAAAALVSALQLANTLFIQHDQRERTRIEREQQEQRTEIERSAQAARDAREQQRQEAERSIKCVEIGMAVAEFTQRQLAELLEAASSATPSDAAVRFENLVNTNVRVFPPAEAAAILRAVRPSLPSALPGGFTGQAQQSFDDLIAELDERGGTAGCDRPQSIALFRAPIGDVQVAALPPPAPPRPPPAAAPPAPAPAPAPAARPMPGQPGAGEAQRPLTDACPAVPQRAADAPQLTVFPQVLRAEDRETARRIMVRASAIDPTLRREAVDNVNARNLQQRPEMRYYYPEDRTEAERLVALIRRAACQEGLGPALEPLTPVYIGNSFRNLPRGRIELWFPALPG
jgi:flagellar motility protein MotE (MotC chaperone)